MKPLFGIPDGIRAAPLPTGHRRDGSRRLAIRAGCRRRQPARLPGRDDERHTVPPPCTDSRRVTVCRAVGVDLDLAVGKIDNRVRRVCPPVRRRVCAGDLYADWYRRPRRSGRCSSVPDGGPRNGLMVSVRQDVVGLGLGAASDPDRVAGPRVPAGRRAARDLRVDTSARDDVGGILGHLFSPGTRTISLTRSSWRRPAIRSYSSIVRR